MEIKTKITTLAVSTSIFIGSTGYLLFNKTITDAYVVRQNMELSSLKEVNNSITAEIPILKKEIEISKGKNELLSNLNSAASSEIQLKENTIKELIAENSALSKLKREHNELLALKAVYVSRIKSLENTLATSEGDNKNLRSEISDLKSKLSTLESRNGVLETKVGIASILKAEKILVFTEKQTKKGTFVKSKLKNADRLNLNFDISENKVAEAGEKIIFIRIKDAKGNLIQTSESNSFVNMDDNISLPYTQKHIINYSNASQHLAVPVSININQLEKGNYTVELYCDGSFSGIKKMQLK